MRYRNFPDEEGTESDDGEQPGQDNSRRYRNFPDEEGTERNLYEAAFSNAVFVTEIFPMRRELKGDHLVSLGYDWKGYRNFPDEEGTESCCGVGVYREAVSLQKFSR